MASRTCRPMLRLEMLEDRLVPSGLLVESVPLVSESFLAQTLTLVPESQLTLSEQSASVSGYSVTLPTIGLGTGGGAGLLSVSLGGATLQLGDAVRLSIGDVTFTASGSGVNLSSGAGVSLEVPPGSTIVNLDTGMNGIALDQNGIRFGGGDVTYEGLPLGLGTGGLGFGGGADNSDPDGSGAFPDFSFVKHFSFHGDASGAAEEHDDPFVFPMVFPEGTGFAFFGVEEEKASTVASPASSAVATATEEPAPTVQGNPLQDVFTEELQQTDLLEQVALFERGSLDAALQQFVERLEQLAMELAVILADAGLLPWLLALAAAMAASELVRREWQVAPHESLPVFPQCG